ncbi:hypothetical protein BC6307_07680 [Sutcliffiella cohnii]|uniref:DUF4362 domain-containing protein n=1 Tax=Sutcliffiella cohnii TaxID=33932 RepID=A0A223KP34_9BACI|nr:DUF4362 domain-containing protein [Sutcliffiella cohnii]AST91166.1 hypothetical protein BC6307_07680 [Sutcliffiella cohnii]
MKTINVFLVLFLGLLFISGCTGEQKSTDIYMYPDNIPLPYIKVPEDIVDIHGELENKERFDEFFLNVEQGIEDSIRVVRYTTEGAPILYDYDFDKEAIKVKIDSTRDGFGQKEIIHTTCSAIKVDETSSRTSYNLKRCIPKIEDNTILIIEHK